MAITGISAISGEQIIAAGAVSAKEAGKASFTTGGNDIQNLYDTVYTNSGSWAGGGASYTGDAQGALDEVYSKSADWDGSYDTLTANSANWASTRNTVSTRSGYWNKAYTTVNDNSAAWGGQALPISAGPGVKMDIVNDTLVFSNDETVLWSGSCKYHNSATLSEKPINFDRLRFYWRDWNSNSATHISECSPNYTTSSNYAFSDTWAGAGSANLVLFNLILNDDFDKTIYFKWGTFYSCSAASVTQATQTEIIKIVGIGRKASN